MKYLTIAALAGALLSYKMHPFYMGITDFKYNKKQNVLEGSVKLFTNDFESALKKNNAKSVDLINGKQKDSLNKWVKSYLAKNLLLKINGKAVQPEFLGFETEKDATYCYIELVNCGEIKQFNLQNSLLYDFTKSQMNIVHVEVNGQSKSAKLLNPEKNIDFKF
jgi:hypothetical protein